MISESENHTNTSHNVTRPPDATSTPSCVAGNVS